MSAATVTAATAASAATAAQPATAAQQQSPASSVPSTSSSSSSSSPQQQIVYPQVYSLRQHQLATGFSIEGLNNAQLGLLKLDKCHHISINHSVKDGPASYRVRICKTCCNGPAHIELGTYVNQESALLVNDTHEIMHARFHKLHVLNPRDEPFLHLLTARRYNRQRGEELVNVLDLLDSKQAARETKEVSDLQNQLNKSKSNMQQQQQQQQQPFHTDQQQRSQQPYVQSTAAAPSIPGTTTPTGSTASISSGRSTPGDGLDYMPQPQQQHPVYIGGTGLPVHGLDDELSPHDPTVTGVSSAADAAAAAAGTLPIDPAATLAALAAEVGQPDIAPEVLALAEQMDQEERNGGGASAVAKRDRDRDSRARSTSSELLMHAFKMPRRNLPPPESRLVSCVTQAFVEVMRNGTNFTVYGLQDDNTDLQSTISMIFYKLLHGQSLHGCREHLYAAAALTLLSSFAPIADSDVQAVIHEIEGLQKEDSETQNYLRLSDLMEDFVDITESDPRLCIEAAHCYLNQCQFVAWFLLYSGRFPRWRVAPEGDTTQRVQMLTSQLLTRAESSFGIFKRMVPFFKALRDEVARALQTGGTTCYGQAQGTSAAAAAAAAGTTDCSKSDRERSADGSHAMVQEGPPLTPQRSAEEIAASDAAAQAAAAASLSADEYPEPNTPGGGPQAESTLAEVHTALEQLLDRLRSGTVWYAMATSQLHHRMYDCWQRIEHLDSGISVVNDAKDLLSGDLRPMEDFELDLILLTLQTARARTRVERSGNALRILRAVLPTRDRCLHQAAELGLIPSESRLGSTASARSAATGAALGAGSSSADDSGEDEDKQGESSMEREAKGAAGDSTAEAQLPPEPTGELCPLAAASQADNQHGMIGMQPELNRLTSHDILHLERRLTLYAYCIDHYYLTYFHFGENAAFPRGLSVRDVMVDVKRSLEKLHSYIGSTGSMLMCSTTSRALLTLIRVCRHIVSESQTCKIFARALAHTAMNVLLARGEHFDYATWIAEQAHAFIVDIDKASASSLPPVGEPPGSGAGNGAAAMQLQAAGNGTPEGMLHPTASASATFAQTTGVGATSAAIMAGQAGSAAAIAAVTAAAAGNAMSRTEQRQAGLLGPVASAAAGDLPQAPMSDSTGLLSGTGRSTIVHPPVSPAGSAHTDGLASSSDEGQPHATPSTVAGATVVRPARAPSAATATATAAAAAAAAGGGVSMSASEEMRFHFGSQPPSTGMSTTSAASAATGAASSSSVTSSRANSGGLGQIPLAFPAQSQQPLDPLQLLRSVSGTSDDLGRLSSFDLESPAVFSAAVLQQLQNEAANAPPSEFGDINSILNADK